MSIKLMTEVWASGPNGQADLLVMLALADWCNDAGECWPSMESVAQKARVEERSARRIVRRLEQDGWLEVAVGGGRHGCNKYTLKLGPKVPRTKSPPDPDDMKPGLSVQETRTRRSPEPSITIKEPSLFGDDAPKPKRRRPETDLPEGWIPNDRNISDAQERGFTAQEIEDEGHRFRDFHAAKGSRFRDWDAAWRTWLGNARKFQGRGMAGKAGPGGYGRGSSIASIVARRHSQG